MRFFLGVKNRISKDECSKKEEVLSSIEERKQYFCVSQKREQKNLPKSFPSSSSFLFIFSITPLGVFSFVRLFVCSFVCLFVKCAYAREETCAISSFAGTCTLPNSTKGRRREKTNKIHVQVLHLQELAHLLTAQKDTRREKTDKKHVQYLHLQDIPRILEAHFHCFWSEKHRKTTLHTGISCK